MVACTARLRLVRRFLQLEDGDDDDNNDNNNY